MRLFALLLAVIGLAATTYGIYLIYIPAAWVFAGTCVALSGLLLIDVGPSDTDDPKPKKQSK